MHFANYLQQTLRSSSLWCSMVVHATSRSSTIPDSTSSLICSSTGWRRCCLTMRSSGPSESVGRVSRGNAVSVRPLNAVVRRMSASPVNVLFQISTCSASRSNESLQILPRRDYLLSIRHEDTQDELRFRRVEALRVTHYRACTVEMVSSYD